MQRRFVVLFAGRERPHSLRDALQRLGGRADTYELLDGPEQDLSKPTVQSIVLAGVVAGVWDGVFMAPPCASFCPALVPRLRSLTEVKGIQPVPARWSAYLAKHNALVAFVAKVATAADAQGTFWAIENPASRRGGWAWWPEQADAPSLWDMPEIVELRRATNLCAVPVRLRVPKVHVGHGIGPRGSRARSRLRYGPVLVPRPGPCAR
jgi:hypothetical protein